MPIGFVLFEDGKPAPGQPGAGSYSRPIVRVDSFYGDGQVGDDQGKVFELEVQTPQITPLDTRWFVLAMSDTGQINGWGVAPGFILEALPIRLAYAWIPLFSGWMAASFTIPVVRQARFVLVTAPGLFQLKCPGKGPDQPKAACEVFTNSRGEVQGFGEVERTVNVSLTMSGVPSGTNMIYSVLLHVETPEFALAGVRWDVRIIDYNYNVVDASLQTSSPREEDMWMDNFFIENPTLEWETPPQRGESSYATISVSIKRRVKKVRALLIYLPEKYRHDIQHPNQLKSLNPDFPVALDREWRIYWNLRWVRILIAETANQAMDFLPGGDFQFKLPIMIPTTMPATMEWYLSLCSDQTCEHPDEDSVYVNLVIANTKPILEVKTFTERVSASSSPRRWLPFRTSPSTVLAMLVWTIWIATCV